MNLIVLKKEGLDLFPIGTRSLFLIYTRKELNKSTTMKSLMVWFIPDLAEKVRIPYQIWNHIVATVEALHHS